MKEAELGWATYYLEVCVTSEGAEGAYLGWAERAREHPDAEVRVLRLPIGTTHALYCIVTQTRELVPPEVLRWHDRLAAYTEAELERRPPFRHPGAGGDDPGNPLPRVIFDRTPTTAWEKGVRTPEAWDEFMQRTVRKRRRA